MTKCATPDRFAGLQNCFPLRGLTIQRTLDSQSPALEDMSVYHGGFHVFVSEQFLDSANVIAVFEEMSGKGMAKSMRGGELVDFCGASGLFDSPLKGCLVQMVAVVGGSAGGAGENRGG